MTIKINFFKNKKKFKKGGSGIKPDLYWMDVLLVTFILIAASLVFGWYFFGQINKGSVPPVANTSEQAMIGKERLDKVLNYFKAREEKSTETINSPSPIIDPSL